MMKAFAWVRFAWCEEDTLDFGFILIAASYGLRIRTIAG
jgi:hypothetical protein